MKALVLLLFLAGCESSPPPANPVWNGRIDIYGTMREVMLEGQTQGRVELAPLQGDRDLVGIGSLSGLEGEVVLLDGVAWCTRPGKLGALETRAGVDPGTRAAMLVTARVPRWTIINLPQGLALAELETCLEYTANTNGLGRVETFPFLIEGAFSDVRAHVLDGRCPEAGPGPAETEPVRRLLPLAHGRLVGFYSRLPAGTLTHAGQKTHVHLLLKEGGALVAHVDDLRVSPGAVLKLPLP